MQPGRIPQYLPTHSPPSSCPIAMPSPRVKSEFALLSLPKLEAHAPCAQLIDTAWSVALHRAQGAGRLLAHILAAGGHGDRPVILIGNSMGARLIFHCLLELSRLKAKGGLPRVFASSAPTPPCPPLTCPCSSRLSSHNPTSARWSDPWLHND